MVDLTQYMSERWGHEFQRRLPALRKRLGVEPWNLDSTNFGVSGNTFRAFRVRAYRPSELYKYWATRRSRSIEPDVLGSYISSYSGFAEWHKSLQSSLRRYWSKKQGESLSGAHRRKLVDLYIKWLSRHNLECPKLIKALEENAHCAIDSQILMAINTCYSGTLPLRKPSMRDVEREITYNFCQDLVDAFTQKYGGSRLLFDYFAWARDGSSIVRRAGRRKK